MADLLFRLTEALNAHDLDAAAGCFHADYRSAQPAHPSRAFVGRAQMRANWAAVFAGVPDFRAEVRRSVESDGTAWAEWHWSGTRTDGRPFEMRGVTIFEIDADQVVAGSLYMEEVEREVVDIDHAVEALSGHRPHR